MFRTVALACLMFLALTPFWWRQEQSKSAAPTQDSAATTHQKTSPIPDKFLNLKVLPKNIEKPKLVDVMKQFCTTFGVRCSYCHAVSDDLTEGSFDSDDKPTKQKARELMKTILEMNDKSAGG
jgi:hypothetical protein